ncbi:hypothetical protein [Marinobacter sp. SS21]|uniref:hypothetical protein n=1 Tax=Marinobacter sp. SS21 TaxID=2979460 RepID=UPI00232F9C02|nr:hypothetical protein [Marinobacter sp. SS21]MDC0664237.1 hypothetical protein [Marinobacter sp. SS21]
MVQPNTTVVPHDQPYYTSDLRNTRLIYTRNHQPFAERVAALQGQLQPDYEASFGYEMSERLYVGLMSEHNQIANGFATPFPVNRQINYVGGTLLGQEFATTSWLDTLIHHETAHNYQINPRNNPVSKTLYRILGMGSLVTPVVPAITPNLFESSFLLEGNAVLNESRHGNGGRLYNGHLKAMTLLQARAGQLTPALLYNRPLRFPYGQAPYVFGGHYQYYLASRYGIDRTNRYFFNRSSYWYWPLLVNAPTRDSFGDNFESLLQQWTHDLATEASELVEATGDIIATSQYFSPLNRNEGEVYFLINETGVRAPELVRLDRQQRRATRNRAPYPTGKLVEQDGALFTVAGRHTSPWRIHQGLYDDNALIVDGTEGRIVQGYLSDGRPVYFDVASSFSEPQLYVGDHFYREVNSSVLIGSDDALYYFVQDGRQRILYRNDTALFSLDTYYAQVVDVDSQGRVYVISNTEHGSGLFRADGDTQTRMLAADNIVDARLVDNNTVLAAAVSAENYYYTLQTLQPMAEPPFPPHLFWDQPAPEQASATQARTTQPEAKAHLLTNERRYSALRDLRYQGTDVMLSTAMATMRNGEEESHWLYSISAQFADPLTQNRFSLFAVRDSDLSHLAGIGYSNSQYFVLAGVQAFGVVSEQLDNLEIPDQSRDFGLSAELRVPLLQSGYWYGEVGGFRYLDYRKREREPQGGQAVLRRQTRFGHSLYPNSRFELEAFGVDDRGDTVSGGGVQLATDFPWQLYGGVSGRYARSDVERATQLDRRGVNLENSPQVLNNDPSILVIPGLVDSTYAREAAYGEIQLTKVMNLDAYAFRFPLSLRREALSLRYRHVNVNGATRGGDVAFDQYGLGLTLDLVVFNIAPIQLTVEYVHSDATPMTDEDSVNAAIAFGF